MQRPISMMDLSVFGPDMYSSILRLMRTSVPLEAVVNDTIDPIEPIPEEKPVSLAEKALSTQES